MREQEDVYSEPIFANADGVVTDPRVYENLPTAFGDDLTIDEILQCKHGSFQFYLDIIECSTCSGNVKLKVFSCDIHERCVIQKAVEGAVTCPCVDYERDE